MSPPASQTANPPSHLAATVALGATLLGAGYCGYSGLKATGDAVEHRLTALEEQVSDQARLLQLYRFEQQSTAGLGFSALVEQIKYWAPLADSGTTPEIQIPVIEDRLRAVLLAMESLGEPAFQQLVDEFNRSSSERDYHVRRWLLNGMIKLDAERAADFLVTLIQSYDDPVPPRMRMYAVDRLMEVDRARAGATLRQLLDAETHRGLEKRRVAPAVLLEHPNADQNVIPNPGFSTFVQRFAATEHQDVEQVLLRILIRRRDYDLMTLQEAVKTLGQLRFEAAAPKIKDLFENPPRNFHPMFRNHCLDAIANIDGQSACHYFKQVLLTEKRDLVISKLTELIKSSCG